MKGSAVAEALFGALARKDDKAVRDLCSPNLRVRQNNGKPMDLETLLSFSAAVHRVVREFCYANPVRSATATGFVEEHALQGVLPDGKRIDLAICVIADLVDGKVVEVREYFDTAGAAGLAAALR